MEGQKSGEGAEKGVISRAFEHIFEAISVTSGVKYLALVSYLEIYNEQIRDLLLHSDKLGSTNALSLKETPNEGVTVPGMFNSRFKLLDVAIWGVKFLISHHKCKFGVKNRFCTSLCTRWRHRLT